MSSSRSHRPRRSLGQNFLVDGNLRRRIVEEAAIEPHDTVLEIGPGQGALTDLLAERAGRLVLVELDRDLAADLRHRFQGHRSVEVVEGDILELALVDMVDAPESVRVVGNIPYNITTPILFHLLSPPRPADILLMVQKEVADRILAEPGTGAFGALTVGVQAVADVERVLSVPPSAFRPRPRVDSSGDPHSPPPPGSYVAGGGGCTPDPDASPLPVAQETASEDPGVPPRSPPPAGAGGRTPGGCGGGAHGSPRDRGARRVRGHGSAPGFPLRPDA